MRELPDVIVSADRWLEASCPKWLMGWRRITNSTNERTTVATVMNLSAQGDSVFLWNTADNISSQQSALLLGNVCSFVFDFVARQKIGGTNLSYYYFKQLPVLPPDRYTEADLAFIVPRVLELTYTAHDLSGWAKDLNYDGLPFAFDPDRRALLRAELDAYYARLYGLTRDELRYILDPADVMAKTSHQKPSASSKTTSSANSVNTAPAV